jgi:hypothetical protein
MPGRDDFLQALEACERASALLLLAMESGTPDPAGVATRRTEQIELLSRSLPAEMRAEEFERLKIVFRVGEKARSRALSDRLSATRNISALQRGLQLARQFSVTLIPRKSQLDFKG